MEASQGRKIKDVQKMKSNNVPKILHVTNRYIYEKGRNGEGYFLLDCGRLCLLD